MPRTGRPPLYAVTGRGPATTAQPAAVVHFRVRVVDVWGSASGAATNWESWRTLTTVVRIPPHVEAKPWHEFTQWLQDQVNDQVTQDLSQFGEYDGDGEPFLYVDPTTGKGQVDVTGYQRVLTTDQIYRTIARGLAADNPGVMMGRAGIVPGGKGVSYFKHMPARGYGEDGVSNHRSFRYHVEGVSVQVLRDLIPPELELQHYNGGCDDMMCVYRMLRDRNPPVGKNRHVVFEPEQVYEWLKQHGHIQGSITDGVTPEAVQAHAKEFGYVHAALDITRGIVCLHLPQKHERNHHYKTVAYTIVGNHVIPFSDPDVIHAIVAKASNKVNRRRMTNYSHISSDNHNRKAKEHLSAGISGTRVLNDLDTKKRTRSLDPSATPPSHLPTVVDVYEYNHSQEESLASQLSGRVETWLDADKSYDERLEGYFATDREDHVRDDISDTLSTTSSHSSSPPSHRHRSGGRGSLPFEYPTADQDDRFHFFTKADGKSFVRERLRPGWQHGDLSHLMHYYVCTDHNDIEFLYDYCVRVLAWDPTTAARSYNGHCHQIRVKNVVWLACPDIDILRRLHLYLHPKEAFRMRSVATYAFRMLWQEMNAMGRYGTNLWDCMSQYPPNLQRLLDNHHPYHRPILLTRTYHPPYGNPYDASSSEGSSDPVPPPMVPVPVRGAPVDGWTLIPPSSDPTDMSTSVLQEDPAVLQAAATPTWTPPPLMVPEFIPMSERQREDLIRSYTAAILKIADDRDQFPIHDLTNQLRPYPVPDSTATAAVTTTIPIGHYLVDLPNQKQREQRGCRELWERLPCFAADGEPRMMSHRMVKALLDRGLIVHSDIRLMCTTTPQRQQRFGATLVAALVALIHKVYHIAVLQDVKDRTVKSLINQLVGLCNGTTVPHTGNRYVFRNLEEAYQLMVKVYCEDSLTRVRISQCMGRDPYWDYREYYHYELSSGGYANKPFHFQPVYNMVLEEQAIRMFDLVRPIPLFNLIQIKIDAVEYRVRPADRYQPWVLDLEAKRVDPSDVASTADWLDRGYLGRYKAEPVRGPGKWHTYHQKEQRCLNATRLTRFYHGQRVDDRFQVMDPEDLEHVMDWKGALNVVTPGADVRRPDWARDYWVEWFRIHRNDSRGVILTGPAGTGKTHCLKACYETCLRIGLRVVRSSFTHAACIQLGFDAVTLSHLFGLDAKDQHRGMMVMSQTFAAHLRTMQIDVLMVDEISMLPLDLLECLMLYHQSAPSTRLILSGDFNQLPPVESHQDFGADTDYFRDSDVFPYLVYDRVRNIHGDWMQLTECMRTDDPLLQSICLDPAYVTTRLRPEQFPVTPHQPIWRFLCHTNLTRKAVNWFCMVRWLLAHPDRDRYDFNLRDEYVRERTENALKAANRPKRGRRVLTTDASTADARAAEEQQEDSSVSTTTPALAAPRFNAAYYEAQYDAMMQTLYKGRVARNAHDPNVTSTTTTAVMQSKWVPSHWRYLQNFTYAVGMEVISRNNVEVTVDGITRSHHEVGGDPPEAGINYPAPETQSVILRRHKTHKVAVVNNRRARIVSINLKDRTVRLEWLDLLKQDRDTRDTFHDADKVGDNLVGAVVANERETMLPAPQPTEEEPRQGLDISLYDLGFNFVPGFCTTCHLAQGETIREHYGILDWNQIRKDPKMAYVAVTRASHPDYLHICTHYQMDPWETRITMDPVTNVIRKIYQVLKNDFARALPMEYLPLGLATDYIRDLEIVTQPDTPSNIFICDECTQPMKARAYLDNDLNQFAFVIRFPFADLPSHRRGNLPAQWSSFGDPLGILPHRRVLRCVCKSCQLRLLDNAAAAPLVRP